MRVPRRSLRVFWATAGFFFFRGKESRNRNVRAARDKRLMARRSPKRPVSERFSHCAAPTVPIDAAPDDARCPIPLFLHERRSACRFATDCARLKRQTVWRRTCRTATCRYATCRSTKCGGVSPRPDPNWPPTALGRSASTLPNPKRSSRRSSPSRLPTASSTKASSPTSRTASRISPTIRSFV